MNWPSLVKIKQADAKKESSFLSAHQHLLAPQQSSPFMPAIILTGLHFLPKELNNTVSFYNLF